MSDAPTVEHPGPRAARFLRESGYKGGGEIQKAAPMVRKIVRKAISEHDHQLHGGKETHLKLKSGGAVVGDDPVARPDRHARGGHVKHHKGKPNIKINIHAGGGDQQAVQQAKQQGLQAGVQLGARAAAAKLAGGAGGAPGGPPPGMMPPPGGMPPAGPPPGMAGGMPPHPPMGPPGAGPMPPRPGMPPQGIADGGHVKMQPYKRRSAGGVA